MREEPVRNAANIGRRIRAHTKSRAGCRNCKVRKVKCDETKPGCKRCHLYGVRCDYGSKNLLEPDLRTPPASSSDGHVLFAQKCSPIKNMLAMINNAIEASTQPDSKSLSSFRLEVDDLNRLERFQSRTILSVGTPITGPVYQEQIIKLVCQHPYLLHAVMTVTCMHERYVRNERRSLIESYHYGQSASLFRRKLSQDVPPSDHDGLWATCALLGTISIFAIDVTTAEEAWPLNSSSTDLEWLGVLDGIHVVWAIVQPTRAGSAFERLSDDRSKAVLLASKDPVLIDGTDHLPKSFIKLCNITQHSTADNNPYLPALNNLAPLLEMECTQNTFLCYLAFTGRMTSVYKQLLHVKDPRALLILAYWYAKLCQQAPWFLKHRALIECRSICLYLERYHNYHGGIQTLLEFPKTECGLLPLHDQPLTPVSLVSLRSSSRESV